MATYNGIGTIRYDWKGRPDGTADATVWFVLFFLPVIPLRREHVCVHSAGLEKGGLLDTAGAVLGSGSGFKSQIEVLEDVKHSPRGILLTYLLGWLVIPVLAVAPPVLLVPVLDPLAKEHGMWIMMVGGLSGLLWMGCVVAKVIDRAAGRHHVFAKKAKAVDRD